MDAFDLRLQCLYWERPGGSLGGRAEITGRWVKLLPPSVGPESGTVEGQL